MNHPLFATMDLIRRPDSLYPLLVLVIAFCLAEPVGGQDAPVPVEVTRALRPDEVVKTMTLSGSVSSQRQAALSPRTEGLVKSVEVDAGDLVEKGDTLLSMDSRLAEIELDLVRAQLETAKIQRDDAVRRFEEVRNLIENRAIAKTEVDSLQAGLAIREAEMAEMEVRAEQARERIERHRLVAPFSGYIARKTTEAGEWVDTGTMVLELVETDALWFDLQVAQEFIAVVRTTEKAELEFDSYPWRTLSAEVDVVVPVKDDVSRTFLTRLTFEDEQDLATPGMSGTATLFYSPADASATIVPRDAVIRSSDGSVKVWVIEGGDESSAKSVPIRTAGALGESVEVIEGLEGGERVVVRGNEGLTEGQVVEVREYDPETRSLLR